MYISKNKYKVPINEDAWYVVKSYHNQYYYAYRRIKGIKERVYIGFYFNDEKKIEARLKKHEKKLNLPQKLRTNFDDFVLIEVEPPEVKTKRRNSEHPKNTKWQARILRNGNTYAYYLYRKIFRKTHRFYLGANPNDELIIRKISQYEEKIALDKKYRTNFETYELEVLDD